MEEGMFDSGLAPVEADVAANRYLRSHYCILVVDDSPLNIMLATSMLHKFGYRCGQAQNGLEAVQAVTAGQFDLVLMDCQMPVMDGYEATRKIRELPDARGRTPVIAVTAYALEENIRECHDAGMNGFLSKPLNMQLLDEMIMTWITAS
jgi:CheY-like chemotaxis protein